MTFEKKEYSNAAVLIPSYPEVTSDWKVEK